MVVNITTNSRGLTNSGQKRFWKDPRDKYYYCFYIDNTDAYLKYKSSPDGVNWSDPVNASHAATGYDNFAVFFDGTYFWIAYQVGASAYPGTGATIWARRGTVSAGTISLDSQVTVLGLIGGYFGGNFCKTTGYVWLAFEACYSSGGYHIWVYNTTDGSSWTQKLNSTTMTDAGYHTIPQIASLEHVGTDQVMIVTGKYNSNQWLYKIWDGSAWGADTVFAEKKTGYYGGGWMRDLWAANGEVHFVYLYNGDGSALRYRNYTSSWQNYSTIDANANANPSISNGADSLRVFYRRNATPTVIYYQEMNYTTHAFGGEQSFISGEANTLNYPSAEKGQTLIYDTCAVTWQTGAAAPYTYRFASMVIIAGTVIPTVVTGSVIDLGADGGIANASVTGSISATGGANCDQRGFDWGYISGVYAGSWTEAGSFAIGSFNHKITGLTAGSRVFFRAKAHNSAGWGYGSESSFLAPGPVGPWARRTRSGRAEPALPIDLLTVIAPWLQFKITGYGMRVEAYARNRRIQDIRSEDYKVSCDEDRNAELRKDVEVESIAREYAHLKRKDAFEGR